MSSVYRKALSSINTESLKVRPLPYFLVVVTSFNNDTGEFLNNLFEASYAMSIININFLSLHQNQTVWLMSTFKPFVKSCDSLQRHDIAVFTEQHYFLNLSIAEIYAEKFYDMRQCPIVAAVFNTPPFVIITSTENQITYDGVDTHVLAQLAKRLNFKLVYRMPPDKQGRGDIHSNGTVSGCIRMVFFFTSALCSFENMFQFRWSMERLILLSVRI